jgi:hypothetical protein
VGHPKITSLVNRHPVGQTHGIWNPDDDGAETEFPCCKIVREAGDFSREGVDVVKSISVIAPGHAIGKANGKKNSGEPSSCIQRVECTRLSDTIHPQTPDHETTSGIALTIIEATIVKGLLRAKGKSLSAPRRNIQPKNTI